MIIAAYTINNKIWNALKQNFLKDSNCIFYDERYIERKTIY